MEFGRSGHRGPSVATHVGTGVETGQGLVTDHSTVGSLVPAAQMILKHAMHSHAQVCFFTPFTLLLRVSLPLCLCICAFSTYCATK